MIVSIVCYARVITSHGRGWGGGGHRKTVLFIGTGAHRSHTYAHKTNPEIQWTSTHRHHHHHQHHHHHHHINNIIGITIIEHFSICQKYQASNTGTSNTSSSSPSSSSSSSSHQCYNWYYDHRTFHICRSCQASSTAWNFERTYIKYLYYSCSRCCWCVASCIGWAVLSSFASSVLVLVLMSLLCSIACWCLQWSAVLLPLRCLRVCFMCGEDSDQAKAEEREFSDRFGLRCQLFFTRIARHREVLLLSGDVRTMPPVTFCLIAAQVYSFMKVHSAIVVLCITLLMGLCLCAYT